MSLSTALEVSASMREFRHSQSRSPSSHFFVCIRIGVTVRFSIQDTSARQQHSETAIEFERSSLATSERVRSREAKHEESEVDGPR